MPRILNTGNNVFTLGNNDPFGVITNVSNSDSVYITNANWASSSISYSTTYNPEFILDLLGQYLRSLNDPNEVNTEIDRLIDELNKLRQVTINSVQEIE